VKITNLNITDATASDNIVISEVNGNPIVNFTANASELDYRIGNIGWVRGVVIATGGLGTHAAVVTISVGSGR
jgi:hypothetical protein